MLTKMYRKLGLGFAGLRTDKRDKKKAASQVCEILRKLQDFFLSVDKNRQWIDYGVHRKRTQNLLLQLKFYLSPRTV